MGNIAGLHTKVKIYRRIQVRGKSAKMDKTWIERWALIYQDNKKGKRQCQIRAEFFWESFSGIEQKR